MNALSNSARLGAISLSQSALMIAALTLGSAADATAQQDDRPDSAQTFSQANTRSTRYVGSDAAATNERKLTLELVQSPGEIKIRIRGGQPGSQALMLVGTAGANAPLHALGIDGSLQVGQVFAAFPVKLDSDGEATARVDLRTTAFSDFRINVHMQVIALRANDADGMTGEASNAAVLRFAGKPQDQIDSDREPLHDAQREDPVREPGLVRKP